MVRLPRGGRPMARNPNNLYRLISTAGAILDGNAVTRLDLAAAR